LEVAEWDPYTWLGVHPPTFHKAPGSHC